MAQPPDRDQRAALANLDRDLRGAADPDELRRLAEWDRQFDPDPLSRALPADPIRVADEPADPLHHAPERARAAELVRDRLEQDSQLEQLFHLSPKDWSASTTGSLRPPSAATASPSAATDPLRPTSAATGAPRALDLPLGAVQQRPFAPPSPPPPAPAHAAVRCDACGKPIPSAFSFCVHCGGQPRAFDAPRDRLLSLRPASDLARRRLQPLLLEAADARADALRALQQPAARFLVHADDARADDLRAQLSELGLEAHLSPLQEPSPSAWFSEGLAALWGSPSARVWGVLAAASFVALIAFHSACWALPAAMALAVAAGLAAQRAQRHPRLDPGRLSHHLSGLSQLHAQRAQRLLQALQDREARAALSAVLQDHRAIVGLSRGLEARWGAAFADPTEALHRALQQYLDACDRFLELERYLAAQPLAELDAQLGAARADLHERPTHERPQHERALAQLSEQRKLVAELDAARADQRALLLDLASRVGHLRARLLALDMRGAALDPGQHPLAAMEELQQELHVLEEVVHEVQRA